MDVLADHAPVGGESTVGDLFGILFLLLLEKETVQNAAEEHRCPGSDPTVDQQPHPFCCLQGMCFCFVFFYRPDGETPSLLATVRSRFPPTVDPYIGSFYSFVDLNTTVLIPRSLSQCNLLGVRDAGGCSRLAESEANRPVRRDRRASAFVPPRPGEPGASRLGPYGALFWDACSGNGHPMARCRKSTSTASTRWTRSRSPPRTPAPSSWAPASSIFRTTTPCCWRGASAPLTFCRRDACELASASVGRPMRWKRLAPT